MNSLELANFRNITHKSVLELIKNNYDSLEQLGKIKAKKFKTKGRPTRYFELNEKQMTLLITKMSYKRDIKGYLKHFNLDTDLKVIEVRFEIEFLRMIKSIVNGFNESVYLKSGLGLKVEEQYPINRYIVDICITDESFDYDENFEEIDVDYPYIVIEIDEELTHKYTVEKDLIREKNIRKKLKLIAEEGEVDEAMFIRVTKENMYESIAKIVGKINIHTLNG